MIARVVIVGGGTAGWMTAAALARAFAPGLSIELLESDRIGTVGVGEATVPSFRDFNRYLGIDEDALLRGVGGSFKLGIDFAGWTGEGSRYFHPFGVLGSDIGGVEFHQLWLRHGAEGGDEAIAAINPEAAAASAGRFGRTTPHGALNYALHLDAVRYARLLRSYAEHHGVRRTEGEIVDVRPSAGCEGVAAVRLRSGEWIEGDLFVDCSGFGALLIGRTLEVGYRDWSHWMPCDRAVALPSPALADLPPFTRARARPAGWQWRIPLQHRTGNGYVYSSAMISDEDALEDLRTSLPKGSIGEPNLLRFQSGRRERSWAGNTIAIGLSAGFLEPLESTSIHLIQTAIFRLIALFPTDAQPNPALVARFNRETADEQESVRDFVLAHYRLTMGRDEPFWQAVRAAEPPDSLTARIETFRETGTILHERGDLFGPTNWYAVLTGQSVRPRAHHRLADMVPADDLARTVAWLRGRAAAMVAALPAHAAFVAQHCPARQPVVSSATTS